MKNTQSSPFNHLSFTNLHKKLFRLLIVLLFFSINAKSTLYAQSRALDTLFGEHYKLVVETPIYLCDLAGNKLSNDLYEAPANAIFTHIGNKGNSVIIRFWLWTDKHKKAIDIFNFRDSTYKQLSYFLMDKTNFQNKTLERYDLTPIFTVGTAAIPFKIRNNPYRFTNDVSIGPVVGAKFRFSRYNDSNFYSLLFGFGLSSVNLDSLSTQGIVKDDSPITNTAALTLSLGAVMEFSNVQIGFFIGKDYINRNKTVKWDYQGKTWLSIGIGYSLFNKSRGNNLNKAGSNKVPVSGT